MLSGISLGKNTASGDRPFDGGAVVGIECRVTLLNAGNDAC